MLAIREYASDHVIALGNSKIAGKPLNSSFVGSFFALDQLPKDALFQVAVAGRSNVGKSSLLNRLFGQKKLAKVSSTPGKTRSLNFYLVNNRFYLVDLPGYGYAKAAKTEKASWRRLIEAYMRQSKRLVGLILLLDCRRDLTEEDMQMLAWLADRKLPALIVLTKTDKISRDKSKRKASTVEAELNLSVVPFSIVTGQGKKELIRSVLDIIENNMNHREEN